MREQVQGRGRIEQTLRVALERRLLVAREGHDADRSRYGTRDPRRCREPQSQRRSGPPGVRCTEPPGRRMTADEAAQMRATRHVVAQQRVEDQELQHHRAQEQSPRQPPLAGQRGGKMELEREDRTRQGGDETGSTDHLAMTREQNARDRPDSAEDQHEHRPPGAERPLHQRPEYEEAADVDGQMDGQAAQARNQAVDETGLVRQGMEEMRGHAAPEFPASEELGKKRPDLVDERIVKLEAGADQTERDGRPRREERRRPRGERFELRHRMQLLGPLSGRGDAGEQPVPRNLRASIGLGEVPAAHHQQAARRADHQRSRRQANVSDRGIRMKWGPDEPTRTDQPEARVFEDDRPAPLQPDAARFRLRRGIICRISRHRASVARSWDLDGGAARRPKRMRGVRL